VNIGTLLAFLIVCAVLIMRKTNPEMPRPFRYPMVPLSPILARVLSTVDVFSARR